MIKETIKKIGDSHTISDEFLRELGHITVSFAHLEESLKLFVIALLNETQRIGDVITAELRFGNLKTLVTVLAKEKLGSGTDFESFEDLLERITKCQTDRNNIMHSGWGTDPDNPTIIERAKTTTKEKHGLVFAFQEYTVKELNEIGDSMMRLSGDIDQFMYSLIDAGKVTDPYKK